MKVDFAPVFGFVLSLENLCFCKCEIGWIFLIQALQRTLNSVDLFSLPQNKELYHCRPAVRWLGAPDLDYFTLVSTARSSQVYSLMLNTGPIKLHLPGFCSHW